jgi:hypothetical protein
MLKRVLSRCRKIRRMLTANRLRDFIQIPKIVTFRQGERGPFQQPERGFYGRICSGVSFGEPLPETSAHLISSTTRRDNGTFSPCRSAISVMTPCR